MKVNKNFCLYFGNFWYINFIDIWEVVLFSYMGNWYMRSGYMRGLSVFKNLSRYLVSEPDCCFTNLANWCCTGRVVVDLLTTLLRCDEGATTDVFVVVVFDMSRLKFFTVASTTRKVSLPWECCVDQRHHRMIVQTAFAVIGLCGGSSTFLFVTLIGLMVVRGLLSLSSSRVSVIIVRWSRKFEESDWIS